MDRQLGFQWAGGHRPGAALPEDSMKVRFVLWDAQDCQLWDMLGGREFTMESNLAQLSVKLKEV